MNVTLAMPHVRLFFQGTLSCVVLLARYIGHACFQMWPFLA